MAVTSLASITNSSQESAEFTPSADFYLLVKSGAVSLAAKLPGDADFYIVSEISKGVLVPVTFSFGTVTPLTDLIAGTVYKIVPQTKSATAKAVK